MATPPKLPPVPPVPPLPSTPTNNNNNTSTTGPLTIRTKAHDMVYMDYWPNAIKHKTDVIQEQLDTGLYAIKRYAFYLQKVVEIRKPALLALKKATEYEGQEKGTRAAKDVMTDFVINYTATQNVLGSNFDAELHFISIVDKDVVNFILNWHKAAEKRLETTNKKLSGVYSKYKDLLMKITKSRQACHKQWSSLQSAYKESEKAEQQRLTKKNGAKEYETAFKAYGKEVQKTYQHFNAFENEVKDANEQQNSYWLEELPQCVKELEQLETERLQTWGLAMENFRNAQYQYYSSSLDQIKLLDTTTASLDGTAGIKLWTDSLVKQYGPPIEPDYIEEHLPCNYTRVQQGEDLHALLSVDLSVALAQRQMEQKASQRMNSMNMQHNQSFNQHSFHQQSFQQQQQIPQYIKPSYAHAVGRVMWDCPQHDHDDLPLHQGDLIAILDMPMPSGDEPTWWIAARFDLQTGRLLQRGIVPSNYIALDM